jgi:hypothetical protein
MDATTPTKSDYECRVSVLEQLVSTDSRWRPCTGGSSALETITVHLGGTGFRLCFFRNRWNPYTDTEDETDEEQEATSSYQSGYHLQSIQFIPRVMDNASEETTGRTVVWVSDSEMRSIIEISTGSASAPSQEMDAGQNPLGQGANLTQSLAMAGVIAEASRVSPFIRSQAPSRMVGGLPNPAGPEKGRDRNSMAWRLDTPNNIDIASGPIWTCPLSWNLSRNTCIRESLSKYLVMLSRRCEECGLYSPDVEAFQGLPGSPSTSWCIACAASFVSGSSVDQDCGVCLAEMIRPYESVCGHMFHRRCAVEWASRGSMSCSVCRKPWIGEDIGFALKPYEPQGDAVSSMPRNKRVRD